MILLLKSESSQITILIQNKLTVGAGLDTYTKAEAMPQNESQIVSQFSKGLILEINQNTRLVKR